MHQPLNRLYRMKVCNSRCLHSVLMRVPIFSKVVEIRKQYRRRYTKTQCLALLPMNFFLLNLSHETTKASDTISFKKVSST